MLHSTLETDLLIIGGGLSGLSLAYYLRDSNLNIRIVEGRNRIGGRIETVLTSDGTPIEMGATWLGNQHVNLLSLLSELGLETFNQKIGNQAIYEAISTSPPYLAQLPPNPEPSKRIEGGTSQLIQRLAEYIPTDHIHLGQIIEAIEEAKDGLLVKSDNLLIKATFVVSTLPPNLLVNKVSFEPKLPTQITELAKMTHTWMGESIKIGLSYKEAFWRAKHLSGTIMSNVGPIPEMYDHSNYEESHFALKGFLNGQYFSLTREERLERVLHQLRKYFGNAADQYISYKERVWRNEDLTFKSYEEHILPHQNNGHSMYKQGFMKGRFFIGGSETASQYPGYMEGAVYRSKEIASILQSNIAHG